MTPGTTQSSICTSSWSNNKVVWWWSPRKMRGPVEALSIGRVQSCWELLSHYGNMKTTTNNNYNWTSLFEDHPGWERWRQCRMTGSTATATTTWLWNAGASSTATATTRWGEVRREVHHQQHLQQWDEAEQQQQHFQQYSTFSAMMMTGRYPGLGATTSKSSTTWWW